MTGQEQSIQYQAEMLAKARGYRADQITKVNLTDSGALASIELGTDADGMGRFVLNFAL